ncbi:MAG: helix-turn-helix transcriptional regulator [Chloroflexi bacterium]|nr:MAG: helix-turn-helix transcriptional regulator [Chloroflexota bacterium]
MTLGERVRAARHQLGMSQAQLAGDELTKGFISQVEAGLVRPSLRSLQVIALRLGRSLDYFIGDESLAGAKRRVFHRLAAQAAIERRDWPAVRHEATAALAQPSTLGAERATLLRYLATADTAEGKREQAFERLAEAMTLVDANSDATELAHLLHARGVLYVEHGQLAAGAESLEAARDVMEQREITDPRLRARTLVHLGTVYRRLHRTAKALATYELALAVASRSSELRLAAQSYMGVAVALYDAGELDAAIANYQRALGLFERVSDTAIELSVMQSLATVQFEHGDMTAARETVDRCSERAALAGDIRVGAIVDVLRARITLEEGGVEDALRLAEDAARRLAELGDGRQQADALRVAAAADHARGDYSASDLAYRRAIELLASIEDHPDLSTLAAEYAQKLRARGDLESAFAYLELARDPAASRPS